MGSGPDAARRCGPDRGGLGVRCFDRPRPGATDPRSRQAAADALRAEIAGLPGAEWVSVETHPGTALEVRLFEAGSGIEAAGAAWDTLRRRIEGAAARLLPARPDPGSWSTPAPVRLGFAEAAAANPLDALHQLAALAAMQRMPAPAPSSTPAMFSARVAAGAVITDEDVGRLARLLALVLPADASEPAAAAVRRFGSFAAVLAAPEAELRRVPGLGTHSIAAIKLVHAAAVRFARAGIAGRPVLDDRKRLADYLSAALARERIEQFRILFLDDAGMLRADEVQAQGTVNHTPVYPREVVRRALALGATSLILVHNHPTRPVRCTLAHV